MGVGAARRRAQTRLRGLPQDILFLGDFNADCSYVREEDWAAIRLRSSEVFKWLIPDSADTTVGNSDCAYDRIVVCGARLRRSLKPQSAAVHDFQEEFGLDQTQVSAGPGRGGGRGQRLSWGPQATGTGRQEAPSPRCPRLAQPQRTWHSPPCIAFLEKALRGSVLAAWTKSGMVIGCPLPLWKPGPHRDAHPT